MKTLTASQLHEMQEQNDEFHLVNVLPEESFGKLHIPGSENVPVEQADFVDQMERLTRSKDDKVVVYCASTDCDASPKAAKKLEQSGFTNVFDFEGGLKEWQNENLPVEGTAPAATD